MILLDTNVLVYAHREDVPKHLDYRHWLEMVVRSDQAFAVHDLILGNFLRTVTHQGVFVAPTPVKTPTAIKPASSVPSGRRVSILPLIYGVAVRLTHGTSARGSSSVSRPNSSRSSRWRAVSSPGGTI